MSSPGIVVPKWATGLLRAIGAVNIVFAAIGMSFAADSIYRFTTGRYGGPTPEAPYSHVILPLMLAIEIVFLAILIVLSIRLLQTRFSAIPPYSAWVVTVILYNLAVTILWRPGPVGLSIAAASAITTDGIFLQLCFCIPSAILLQVAKWCYRANRSAIAPLSVRSRNA